MEDAQGDVSLGHAIHELHHGLLIVISGKGGRQPQAEAPIGNHGRLPGQISVGVQHRFEILAADDAVGHLLTRHRELNPSDAFRSDLERDLVRTVDKESIIPIAQIEGDVFIGLIGIGASVGIPNINALAVFDEAGETLAQTIDLLADRQIHLVGHEDLALGIGHQALGAEAGAGYNLAIVKIFERREIALVDFQGQASGSEGPALIVFIDGDIRVGRVQVEGRAMASIPPVIDQTRGDDVGPGAGYLDGHYAAIDRLPGLMNGPAVRAIQGQLLRLDLGLVDIGRITDVEAFFDHPHAI